MPPNYSEGCAVTLLSRVYRHTTQQGCRPSPQNCVPYHYSGVCSTPLISTVCHPSLLSTLYCPTTRHGVPSHYSQRCAVPLFSIMCRHTTQHSVPSLYSARCAIQHNSAWSAVPLLSRDSVLYSALCAVPLFMKVRRPIYSAGCAAPQVSTVCCSTTQHGVLSHSAQQGVPSHYIAGCAVPLLITVCRPATQHSVSS